MSAFLTNGLAAQEWLKDSELFTDQRGEIQIGERRVPLNVNGESRSGQTPPALILESQEYSWTTGFRMDDGSYYAYESELEIWVPFTESAFEEAFDYEEEALFPIVTQSEVFNAGAIKLTAEASCGNSDWAANNDCKITSCSYTEGGTSISGSSCSTSDGNGNAFISRITNRGFTLQLQATGRIAGTVNVPTAFQDVFGSQLSSSASVNAMLGTTAADSNGTGATTRRHVRAILSLVHNYYYTEDWQGQGFRVGAYNWSSYYDGYKSGYYVVDDTVAELPFYNLNSFRLSASGALFFVLHGNDLYSFEPGQPPKVVMENTSSYPEKVFAIQGGKI